MMRQTLIAFALIALLLAACGTSQPGRPSPTVLGTQGPAATQPPIVFWMPDAPQVRAASAFGSLPPERQAKRVVTIGGYQLATTLPTVPATLNVYIAGGYPDSDTGRAAVFGEAGWQFVPYF